MAKKVRRGHPFGQTHASTRTHARTHARKYTPTRAHAHTHARARMHTLSVLCYTFRKHSPNFIFQCYRPQTWQFFLFFPALSISSIQSPKYYISGWVGHVTHCCKRPIRFRCLHNLVATPSMWLLVIPHFRK